MSLAVAVDHPMQIACIQMATASVSHAMHGSLEREKLFTITTE
jgi:hypothetical protein